MKKVIIVLVTVVLQIGYVHAQFAIGVRTGLSLTNISEENDGEKPSADEIGKFKPGFQTGVIGEYSITKNVAIQTGILFATQGSRNRKTEKGIRFENSINLNYIQVPVNAQFKFDLEGIKLLLHAGPYLGFGVGGNLNTKISIGGGIYNIDQKIKFGDNINDDVSYIEKAFDFGIGFGAGLQFGSIQVGLVYNVGLADMCDDDTYSIKNHGLALTATYFFGK